MFQQLRTIAGNTFTESIRQPIFIVLILVGGMLLILNTFLSAYTLDDDNTLLMDMGLSTLLLAGLLIAAFTATGVLANELENKTVLTVISKPVSRPLFIVGKYVGVAAAIMLAVLTLSLVFLLTIRHKVMQSAADEWDMPVIFFGFGAFFLALGIATLGNYLYNWVFPSTFALSLALLLSIAYVMVLLIGPKWEFQALTAEFEGEESQLGQLMVVMLLVFQAVMILTALAIACSTRLGQIMTLMICVCVFLLGLVNESWLGNFLANFDPSQYNAVLGWVLWALAKLVYTITPNLQFLWQTDALANYYTIPATHVLTLSAYSALQIVAFLGLAIGLFQTREVG